ncbi:MAG TPA: hypothetical protein PLW81_09085 [Thiobacillaceae bacterium]|nr:hypothetical protein [Thiobacillaceae bacterium]
MQITTRHWTFAGLLALLALTRVGHFGTVVSLPDASLAVFLFGGLWLGGPWCFAALMATAFGIDVFLARTATEAGWCLTPAYGGLVLTYGLMWAAGRLLARTPQLPAGRFALVSLAAVGLAFLVSNLSFWAFSGYFGDMDLAGYAASVARYFPPYLGSAAVYLALGWIVRRVLLTRLTATA